MKRCSRCNEIYGDDMMFCLSDGTPLGVMIAEIEQPTVVRSAPSNVGGADAGGSGSPIKFIAGGIALLLIFGFLSLAVAALIFWPRNEVVSNTTATNQANTGFPTPTRTPETPSNADRSDIKAREDELERERRKLAEERKKLDDDRQKKIDVEPDDTPRFTDPGTSRITFRRGSVGETVSGTVGRARSYVLRAMAGQYLTASLRSDGGCVVFSGGSASTAFNTSGGDTRLNIQNNCGRPTNFSLNVVVR